MFLTTRSRSTDSPPHGSRDNHAHRRKFGRGSYCLCILTGPWSLCCCPLCAFVKHSTKARSSTSEEKRNHHPGNTQQKLKMLSSTFQAKRSGRLMVAGCVLYSALSGRLLGSRSFAANEQSKDGKSEYKNSNYHIFLGTSESFHRPWVQLLNK